MGMKTWILAIGLLSACAVENTPEGIETEETDAGELELDTGLQLTAMAATPSTSPRDGWRGLAGKCIDVAGNGTANGTPVRLWACNQSNAQRWKARNGTVRVLGKCMDVKNGATANGTPIQIWGCDPNNANQQWTYNGGSLMAKGKCLDVPNGNQAPGTKVQLYTCNNTASQEWRYIDGSFRTPQGRCLDVSGGSSANGTRLQIYSCNGSAAQTFTLHRFELVGNTSGKCLDIPNNNQQNGQAVQLYGCNGSTAQRWTLDRNDLKSTSGRCLDVDNVHTINGTTLKLWSCVAGRQQDWYTANTPAAPRTPLNGRPSSFPIDCGFAGSCVRSSSSTAHTGSDWAAPAGTRVYSVCDGTIAHKAQGGSVWNRLVIVQCNGLGGYPTLYAYYGHIDTSLATGAAVSTGQDIGAIANDGGNSHVHFALSTSKVTSNWGYASVGTSTASGCGGNNARRDLLVGSGWIDPDSFADSHGWWGQSSTDARGCP